MPLMRVLLLTVFALAGCHRMYWGKVGENLEHFKADHQACLVENSTPVVGRPTYGVIDQRRFSICLKARGWQRHEIHAIQARSEGWWFRGIEEPDGAIVRLDVFLPEQVTPFDPEVQAPQDRGQAATGAR